MGGVSYRGQQQYGSDGTQHAPERGDHADVYPFGCYLGQACEKENRARPGAMARPVLMAL